MIGDHELLDRARGAGYELVERHRRGWRTIYQWQGSGPIPGFYDRGEALRWVQDYLRRRLIA